jgi:hypothetical protein
MGNGMNMSFPSPEAKRLGRERKGRRPWKQKDGTRKQQRKQRK